VTETVTRNDVQAWLDRYIEAWRRNERQPILDLFSEDATYSYGPYREPVRGREAIADAWLDGADAPGSWQADYVPIAVDGSTAVIHGRSRYFNDDRTTLKTEFDNIFVIRFDSAGRATEFAEWFAEKPVSPG
jgi:ketosteroid isomerase-like protein